MITKELSETIRHMTSRPIRGFVELVNDLLDLSRKQGLLMDWHGDKCRLRIPGLEGDELVELPRGKTYFRMILASVAVLCNELKSESVSLYGGEGELLLPSDPSIVIKLVFSNTTSRQRLELSSQASTP